MSTSHQIARDGWIALSFSLFMFAPAAAQPASAPADDAPTTQPAADPQQRERLIRGRTIAELFLDHLYRGEFERAAALFGGRLITEMPPDRLPRVRIDIDGPSGTSARPGFESLHLAATGEVWVGYRVVGPRAAVDIEIIVSAFDQIIGIRIVPRPKPSDADWPPYARLEMITERVVSFGEKPWVIEGSLTLPRGDGPFPGVVLLHGFGPQDRDQQSGSNRPFRDLAWGLASKGVAVLRYDKRTQAHGRMMGALGLTLENEVFEDARLALQTLRAHPSVDARRVFLVGHTFGATLAPAVAATDDQVTGVVMLAPSAIPVLDLLVRQGELRAGDVPATQAVTDELDKVRAAVEQIRNRAVPPNREILGAAAGYWYELSTYDGENAIRATKSLERPILLLSMGRDASQTGDDFPIWKERLAGAPGITLDRYPDLTQQLMPGTGEFSQAEYAEPNHVDERIVERIAGWIRRIPPTPE